MEERGRVPALDGLRGVAILLVVLGHAGTPGLGMAAGAGVTLFFVLSGYLITGLLLAEQAGTGRIDLRRFYLRRAARLLPALMVMLPTVGLLFAASDDVRMSPYWQEAAQSVLFLNNLAGLFGWSFGALSHTWSLAVEEQFYLLWPAAILTLGRRRLLSLFLLGAVAGIAWRLLVWEPTTAGQERAMHTLDVNAFALLLGAAVAVAPTASRRIAPVLLATLSVVVAGSQLVQDAPVGLPHVALGPAAGVVSAGLVWASARGEPLLERGWLRYCGRISYSWYLWHWPLTWGLVARDADRSVAVGLAVAAVTFGVAAVSWHCLERPILDAVRRSGTDTHPVARQDSASRKL